MLERAKNRLSAGAFSKYYHKAKEQFSTRKNQYLIDSIHAAYARFNDEAYRFKPAEGFGIKRLSDAEVETIDRVISELGDLNTKQIVSRIHKEIAYQITKLCDQISYSHARHLSIE
ncbi:MAG TPA: SocA family protein [Firmicutes bacterium]|jgi:hypothetical protein|nr:SocA family protein [Bacillota bacterium]